jgi:hypothetical protein
MPDYVDFDKLGEKMPHTRSEEVMRFSLHGLAALLAIALLLPGALPALSATADEVQFGTLAGRVEPRPLDMALTGEGLSPQNLVSGQWTWGGGVQ